MSGRGELLLIVAALVGQVEVESKGRHFVLGAGQSVALAAEGPARPSKPAFGGQVVAVAADGKALTLEAPPAKPDGKALRRSFQLTPRTKYEYFGVPRERQRPTVGYRATVWLEEGSADAASLVRLGLKGRILSGVVVAVSADGKTVTLGADKPGVTKRIEIKIVPGTKVVYEGVTKGERPTVGYFIQAWLRPGSPDTADGITFSGTKQSKPAAAAKAGGPKPTKGVKPTGPEKRPGAVRRAPPPPARDAGPTVALIDREVERRLAEARVPASPLADDSEFLRRVTLDLTGRVPTYQETVAFLADRSPDRRRRVIDELLASPAYGQHFAAIWGPLLAPRQVGTKPTRDTFSPWLAEQFNAGRGWGAIVGDLLTVEGAIQERPQSAFLMANGENFHPQPNQVAGSAARLFMGTQLRCAECHNHPFAPWTQADFWGTAAFFSRLHFTGHKGAPRATLLDQPGTEASIVIPASAGGRPGQTVKARFLGGAELRLQGGEVPRKRFAAWLTGADNPYFARAAVNRAWAHFFSRGLVNPVDDLDAAPASHPELLTALAREYAASGFDHKHLARCICNSKAYQRSSRPVTGNEEDAALFSHMALKPLSPESFRAALAVVLTGDNSPPQPTGGKPRPTGSLGDAGGEAGQGIPQRLALLNGPLLNRGAPFIDRLVKTRAPREQAITDLYLTALSRRPTATELELMSGYLSRRPDAAAGYRGVLWMLLNSSEFALNH
jgi:hypothetical protein